MLGTLGGKKSKAIYERFLLLACLSQTGGVVQKQNGFVGLDRLESERLKAGFTNSPALSGLILAFQQFKGSRQVRWAPTVTCRDVGFESNGERVADI